MTGRELGRTLAQYAIVGTVTAVAATVVPIPFDGLPKVAATADAAIVTAWAGIAAFDALAARAKGGRS